MVQYFWDSYCALTAKDEPFPWQERLFLRLCEGEIPKDVVLPTGCGKTSTMVLWLLALAYQGLNGPECIRLPRRLVWVVNRRVVVDQATTEAEQIWERLSNSSEPKLEPVRTGLKQLIPHDSDGVIGVSTLRGQCADNAEWREHPARPAIVVGTVDMIGSRLLFSGYGRGYKSRPLHAGFIGQDSLLVHDEAHLEPAFQKLIEAVKAEQDRCREYHIFHVMALTATPRTGVGETFRLTEADLKNEEIGRRVKARKGLVTYAVDGEKKIAERVLQRALAYKDSGQAILVFLKKVEDVQDVVGKLEKNGLNVLPLTGTIRGYERDRLTDPDGSWAPCFGRFARDMAVEPLTGTVYLICTAAGEVGINISADHLISDLTPFDSMAQRLGRVNRFGSGDAKVEVVYATTGNDEARERTLVLIEKLPERADGLRDCSPSALDALPAEERQAAFSPQPQILPVSDILFDAWAFTSVRKTMPGRPPVAAWLHGIEEEGQRYTYVAWREEVDVFTDALREEYDIGELLDDYPLKVHELLRDTESRVSKQLKRIADRQPETKAWLVDPASDVRSWNLRQLLEARSLDDCTVVLPPSAGGLSNSGMLDGGAKHEDNLEYDVADEWKDELDQSRRQRVWNSVVPGMRLVREVAIAGSDDEAEVQCWRWYVRSRSADDDGSWNAVSQQELNTHLDSAHEFARDLVVRLALQEPEATAIVCAAMWHDLGKRRRIWQQSIGNFNPELVLAKAPDRGPRVRTNYRHELGSAMDVSDLAEFQALPMEAKDLVLHTIAAHHGRARPHFDREELFDPEHGSERALAMGSETVRRFARLQRRYGRWGLAYLESLVRAADALASEGIKPKEASV
jgi:CRISPR-associated endonuclease/helicase Cas3